MRIGECAVEVLVPGVPIPASRPRVTQGGAHTFTPERYSKHKRVIAKCAVGAKHLGEGPLHLDVRFYLPIPASSSRIAREEMRRGARLPVGRNSGDFDNLAKACADALNRICYEDDSQIVSARITKLFGEDPRTEIRLHPYV